MVLPDQAAKDIDPAWFEEGENIRVAAAFPSLTNSGCNSKAPDDVIILPWNLQEKVMRQLAYIRAWGGQFFSAVTRLRIA